MTAPSPALTFVHDVAYDVALQDETPEHALAEFRAKGLTPDRDALSEAVAAIQLRDRFLDHQGDPVAYTGIEFGQHVRVWDEAVAKAETELESALRTLARPTVHAVAS
jgi:hypothetical protein